MAVKYITIILTTILEIYCIDMFIRTFTQGKALSKGKGIAVYCAVTAFQVASSLFLQGIPLLLCSITTAFVMNFIYKSKPFGKIVLTFSVMAVNGFGEFVTAGILMLIKSASFEQLSNDPYMYSLCAIVSKFIMFVAVLTFSGSKNKLNTESIGAKYIIGLSVFPISTITLHCVMFYLLEYIDSNTHRFMLIALSLFLVFSNIVVFDIINRQNAMSKTEYELKLLKNSIEEQTKHYEDLKVSQEEIRQMRHNMKHVCVGAIASLEAGNTGDTVQQLRENLDTIERSAEIIDTGHPAIDTIIENKLKRCKRLGIDADISYLYKSKININEIEIAVIVGNILDNAIEACQKLSGGREIWGSILSDSQNIIIDIKNTANGDNNLKTEKADKNAHGFGIKSINHITQKHNGTAKFSFDSNIFTAFVILEN